MGSSLSPALCLMVVSISEQIWSINFKQVLSNHNLFIKHIRYVDNRLIFGDARLKDLTPYEVLLEGFYGKPIILETEPDQEFLGFMLETQPLELIYNGPTNISQVLSPYSASPPKVLLSGFHIVVKGAFPEYRVRQGLDQQIQLYTMAGFASEEVTHISSRILDLHHVEEKDCFFAAHHSKPFHSRCPQFKTFSFTLLQKPPTNLPTESTASTPATNLEREARRSFKSTEAGHPRYNDVEARSMKKKRTHAPVSTSAPAITVLPIIRDHPTEGPTSDDSDVELRRRRSPSDTRLHLRPAAINPSASAADHQLPWNVLLHLPFQRKHLRIQLYLHDRLSTITYVLEQTSSASKVTHGRDPHGRQSGSGSSEILKPVKHVGSF